MLRIVAAPTLQEAMSAVYGQFGAWLEYEMEVLGVLPPDLAKRIAEKRPHRLKDDLLAPLRARMPKT